MIGDLKPYAEYKDSGLPWLGKVPAHWDIKRNGSLFQQRNAVGEPDWPILEVSLRTGVRIRQFGSTKRKQVMSDKAKYKCAKKGDFVYNMMRMWQGAAGIAPVDGLASPAYVVAKPFPHVNPAYFASLFRTEDYLAEIDAFSRGIVKDRNRLYWDQFKQIPTPFPPPAEQAAIVRFLDWANGRLERSIRAKRKVIALLNEQKQAIIHRAITRGLDPNVEFKASGIPWLGDIPVHWETPLIQRIFKEEIRPNIAAQEIQLSLSQKDGLIATSDMRERSLQTSSFENWKVTLPGDLVLNRFKAHLGVFFEATLRGIVSFHYGVFAPRWRLSAKYFELLFHTHAYRAIFAGRSNGMTVGLQNLSNQNFYGVRAILPPHDEQVEIVSYTEKETLEIRTAISRLDREIDLLREYRTRLVADVVTGKLDVREAASRLPDEELLPDLAAADDEPDDLPVEEEADS